MNCIINDYNWKILVSSCLLGLKTRYDWKSKPQHELLELLKLKDVVFYCPEQWWGLSTPREPAEIEFWRTAWDVLVWKAKIISKSWKDVSKEYLKWAYETLEICKNYNISLVILKSKSPSCWFKKVFNWKFEWSLVDWNGVTAELLKQNNIQVFTENDFK